MGTSTSESTRRHRRKVWLFTSVVAVLAVVGVTTWKVWPSEDPSISIPDRVCQGSLSSETVKSLFPEHGEPFQEERSYNFFTVRPESSEKPSLGQCEMSGGGRSVEINYSRLQSAGGYTSEDVERRAAESGSTPLTLGEARGFHKFAATELFVSCPMGKDRGALLEIAIGASGFPDEVDRATIKQLAALAADAARFVAQDVVGCEGAQSLPDGPPQLG